MCHTEVGLALKGNRVEPKIQPRAQNLAQGLVGQLPCIVEDQIYESPISVNSDQESQVR